MAVLLGAGAGIGTATAGDTLDLALGTLSPLSEEALGDSHGMARIQADRIQINDQDVTGVVTDNVAINNHTGDNTISGGAYSDSAGFMTTIQNTGNNVLIQNSTIINVAVEP